MGFFDWLDKKLDEADQYLAAYVATLALQKVYEESTTGPLLVEE
ncbi:MAG: hypothetical protein WC262_12395 [Bacteroidales bacterium]|jgi:hypothetical protein